MTNIICFLDTFTNIYSVNNLLTNQNVDFRTNVDLLLKNRLSFCHFGTFNKYYLFVDTYTNMCGTCRFKPLESVLFGGKATIICSLTEAACDVEIIARSVEERIVKVVFFITSPPSYAFRSPRLARRATRHYRTTNAMKRGNWFSVLRPSVPSPLLIRSRVCSIVHSFQRPLQTFDLPSLFRAISAFRLDQNHGDLRKLLFFSFDFFTLVTHLLPITDTPDLHS